MRAATPSLKKVPVQYRAELESLEELGDDELSRIADSRLASSKQRRLTSLLRENQLQQLDARDRQALFELRTETDRLMLRRAYAALLLKYRGHAIPNPQESGE